MKLILAACFVIGFTVGFMSSLTAPAPVVVDGMTPRPAGGWGVA